MKYLPLIFLLLFPFILMSQEKDEFQYLSIDELLNLKSEVKSNDIEVSKDIANSGGTINIGLLLPYSLYNVFSTEIENAVKLAVDEINRTGGVLNKKLLVIPADDAGNNIESLKKASKLVMEYNVSAIIGPTSSTRLLHVAKSVTIPSNVCLMSSGVSASNISDLVDNDLVWRVSPFDRQETYPAAHYIINDLKKKNISVICVNNDFGRQLFASLEKDVKKLGGKISNVMWYSNLVDYQVYNLKNQLDKFFSTKPEVIYLVTNPYEGALITQRIEDGHYLTASYNPIFFSSSSNKGFDFLDNSSEKVLESMYGISQKLNIKADFIEKFEEIYGNYPSTPESSGVYDIIYLIAYAMQHAQSHNSIDYVKHIRAITSAKGDRIGINEFERGVSLIGAKREIKYEGASGRIEFDKNGDPLNPEFEIWKIIDNRFKVIK